jgi:hypothetical protein
LPPSATSSPPLTSAGEATPERLLEAILAETPGEAFPYSLLRAYRPILYERYGWATIDQDLVRATLPSGGDAPAAIERFADEGTSWSGEPTPSRRRWCLP